MTFDETDVQRDTSGRFSVKNGSAANVALPGPLDEREQDIRAALTSATPGTNGASIAWQRGRQELEDAATRLPEAVRSEFIHHSQHQPSEWIAGRAHRAAEDMRPFSEAAAREIDAYSERAAEVSMAAWLDNVRYNDGALTLDEASQRNAADGLAEMLRTPLSRDGAHVKDYQTTPEAGVSGVIRVSKTSVSGNVLYHVETDDARSLSLDEAGAERLALQLQHDLALRD